MKTTRERSRLGRVLNVGERGGGEQGSFLEGRNLRYLSTLLWVIVQIPA